MDYTRFVKEYETVKDKSGYVDKHIKTTYLGYSEKMSIARGIANISSHLIDSDGNTGEYHRDTITQYFHTQMNIVKYYTDIEVPVELVVNAYDALCKCGAMSDILTKLETECAILKCMVQMAMDDTYINEWDISALLNTKFEALRLFADTALSALQTISEKEPEGDFM